MTLVPFLLQSSSVTDADLSPEHFLLFTLTLGGKGAGQEGACINTTWGIPGTERPGCLGAMEHLLKGPLRPYPSDTRPYTVGSGMHCQPVPLEPLGFSS